MGDHMTEKNEAPGSVYQALLKAAQLLVRAHDPKPAKTDLAGKDPAKTPPPSSEYMIVAARLAVVEEASQEDIVELARQAFIAATARREGLRADLESLKTKHSDHQKRRRELADAAQGYDWSMVFQDKQDFIGPFKLEHSPDYSKIMFGRLKLRILDYPSGLELFEAIKYERRKLEDAARSLWPALKEKLQLLQQDNATFTWAKLVKAFEEPGSSFKKVEASVLYSLTLLRSDTMESGWSLSTMPPALAQQSSAISLPRIDRPGAPDRVFAIRVNGPGTKV